VHADWLAVTVPNDERLPLDKELSIALGIDHVRDSAPAVRRVGQGTLKTKRYGSVELFSFSGAALEFMRQASCLELIVHTLACVPRVTMTRLDIAHDFVADGPAEVQRIHALVRERGYAFGRKPTPHVRSWLKCGAQSAGRDTGSVYIGQLGRHDVCATAYDKREERLSHGHPDPGPLMRVEARFGKRVGATFRDVIEPAALFWHYVGSDLCPDRPERVPAWRPSRWLPAPQRRVPPAPGEALKRRASTIEGIRALGELAASFGPQYVEYAAKLVAAAVIEAGSPHLSTKRAREVAVALAVTAPGVT
jgi:hypothetical protein